MRRLILICTFLTIVQNGSAVESPEITLPELCDHVSFLASDSLKGREPGTAESKIAADYIKKHMTRDAVEVLYDNGFQEFEFTSEARLGHNNSLSFRDIRGIAGETFIPLSYSENTSLSASVVFVGYGFEFKTDSLAWHDYDGVEVNRKWVLILRGYPQDQSTGMFESQSPLRKKVLLAKDNDAAGVLFVSGPTFDEDDLLLDLRYEQSQGSAGIPVLQIKRELADRLLAPSGKNVENLEKEAGLVGGNSSFDTNEELRAEIEIVKI